MLPTLLLALSLIACGPSADQQLVEAARAGDVASIEQSLKQGAELETRDNTVDPVLGRLQRTPLAVAAADGHLAAVEALLAAGADPNARALYGETVLHHASTNGHAEIVKVLLAKGADPNAIDDYGITPLMRAAQGGHHAIVELLLGGGANASARDASGRAAMDFARVAKHKDLWQRLKVLTAPLPEPEEEGTATIEVQ